MKLKNLVVAVGTAAAFCVSGAQAASFVPEQTLVVNRGSTYSLFQTYFPDPNPKYYELVNATMAGLLTRVELIDTVPDFKTLDYRVYLDADLTTGLVDTSGGAFLTGQITDEARSPFFAFLMDAGKQYVLELASATPGTLGANTTISAVPLPGALWLFGSALLGFLGFSSRRKV